MALGIFAAALEKRSLSPYTRIRWRVMVVGRNAATRVSLSTKQFDWKGHKIKGNRKKTPRKCLFQGRNLKVTTPEEGRGKEKVETCSVVVTSEVGFLGVQWRSSPHNLGHIEEKYNFKLFQQTYEGIWKPCIPHLQTPFWVSHDPKTFHGKNASWTTVTVPRCRKNGPVGQRHFSSDKTRKGAQGPFFHFFLAAVRALSSSTSKLRIAKEACAPFYRYDIKHGGFTTQQTCQLGPSTFFSHCRSTCGCCWRTKNCQSLLAVW